MFLADDLQNEIKTSCRAFPWKGCGRRRRGQPGSSTVTGRALLHLNLGYSSPSSGDSSSGVLDKEKEAEQSCQISWVGERGSAASSGIPAPCAPLAPSWKTPGRSWNIPGKEDTKQAPWLQEHLIWSPPQKRRRAYLHFPSEAWRDVSRYIIRARVCPRPARRLQELWKHLHPSHLNACFTQIFLEDFKRHRLIFCHASVYFFPLWDCWKQKLTAWFPLTPLPWIALLSVKLPPR